MSVHTKFRIGLLSLLLTAGSTGAFADVIDFEVVTPVGVSSFSTGAGGIFNFAVDSGSAIVDVGTVGYSTNGTKALYVLDSGKVTLSAPGHIMDVASFYAAIASVSLLHSDPSDPSSPILIDLTSNTNILVTGSVNSHFPGGIVTAEFPLSSPSNESFVIQSLPSTFKKLDWVSFAFVTGTSPGVCDNGCSTDFAIDNIALTTAICDTSTAGNACSNPFAPGPTNPIPEPETYAMLLAGLGVLGLVARRRKQKEAAAA